MNGSKAGLLLFALFLSTLNQAQASTLLVEQASRCLTELHHLDGLNPLASRIDTDMQYGELGQGAFTFLDLARDDQGQVGFLHYNPHQLPAAAFCALPGGIPRVKPVYALVDTIMARPADPAQHLLSTTANLPRILKVNPDGKTELLGLKEKINSKELLRATCRTTIRPFIFAALKAQLVRVLGTVDHAVQSMHRDPTAEVDGVNRRHLQLSGALRTCSVIRDKSVQDAVQKAQKALESARPQVSTLPASQPHPGGASQAE